MKALQRLFLSAALVLALFAGCISAGASAPSSASDPEGVWKLTGMTQNGQTTTKEDLDQYEKLGMVMYMELRGDGTVLVSGFGEEMSGTWDDKAVTISGSAVPWTLEKDVLTLENEGDSMTYERTTIDAIYAILGYKDGILDETVKYSGEEQTLLDTDDALVKITGYQADKTGFSISIESKNKTDHDLLVSTDSVYLNKYIFKPVWAAALEPGQTRTTTLVCTPADLERSGITAVDELILTLQVADSENWKILTKGEVVTVYPTGKKTQEVKVPDRTPAEKETVVLDNDDFVFILLGGARDPVLGYTIDCYYENKTDKPLALTWGSATVNGENAVAIYAEDTLPGTRGYTRAILLNTGGTEDGKEETKEEEIKEVSSQLRIIDRTGDIPQTMTQEDFTFKP